MEYKKIYNWANLFKNKNGGIPMFKDKQPILNNEGKNVLQPSYTCQLLIKEPLAVGEYEIQFREKVSQKGNTFFGGGIRIKDTDSYQNYSKKHVVIKQDNYHFNKKTLAKVSLLDELILNNDEAPF